MSDRVNQILVGGTRPRKAKEPHTSKFVVNNGIPSIIETQSMSIFRDFGSAAKNNAAPVTTGLVVAIVMCFLLLYLGMLPQLLASMVFQTGTVLQQPWTLLTYPFVTGAASGPLGVLFLCMWLWGIGGSLERELGSAKYLAVWFIFSILFGISVLIGSMLLHVPGTSVGAWSVVSALTVMWGTRNPTATILLMFVIPITGKWLAWISAGLIFFGTVPPQLAAFAVAPLALAYLFAANKLAIAPFSRGDIRLIKGAKKIERYDANYYEEVRKREKDREERERLRKLFEGD